MKKILIPILILLCTLPALSQTGTGWVPYRTKANFRDSTYHYRDANFNGTLRVREGYVRIGAVTVTANGTELNILDGALVSTTELNRLVGVTSNIQTQLNAKLNTANPQATGVLRIGTDTAATMAGARVIATAAGAAAASSAVDTLYDNAYNLADLAWLKTDTALAHKKIPSYDQMVSYVASHGSGGGSSTSKLVFIVGTTAGAPVNADTSFTLSALAGRHIEMIRGTSYQYPNPGTANSKNNGFVMFNNTTGEIRVRPAFSTGEIVQVFASDQSAWTSLTFTASASSLLTDLVAGWQLDETAGNTANGVLGTLPGTLTGVTVNQSGRFGRAYQFSGAGNVNMGTASALRLQTYTISFWINTTQTEYAGLVTNWVWSTPRYYGFDIVMAADGTLENHILFTDASSLMLTSTATVNDGQWHNIIATWDGTNAYLYIDNVQQDTDGGVAKTIQYHANCAFHLGDRNEGDQPLVGYMDAPFVWSKVVSSGERATLQIRTYPF